MDAGSLAVKNAEARDRIAKSALSIARKAGISAELVVPGTNRPELRPLVLLQAVANLLETVDSAIAEPVIEVQSPDIQIGGLVIPGEVVAEAAMPVSEKVAQEKFLNRKKDKKAL